MKNVIVASIKRQRAIQEFNNSKVKYSPALNDAIKQSIEDMQKIDQIEQLFKAAEVPGGLLLAIREVLKLDK